MEAISKVHKTPPSDMSSFYAYHTFFSNGITKLNILSTFYLCYLIAYVGVTCIKDTHPVSYHNRIVTQWNVNKSTTKESERREGVP